MTSVAVVSSFFSFRKSTCQRYQCRGIELSINAFCTKRSKEKRHEDSYEEVTCVRSLSMKFSIEDPCCCSNDAVPTSFPDKMTIVEIVVKLM